MVTYALCAVAESELHTGEMKMAAEAVRAVRGIIQEIGLAISGPQHVSCGAVRELTEYISELQHRLGKIDTAIRFVS